jgi:hypothetical protein
MDDLVPTRRLEGDVVCREYWILDTGYWILDTGYWILDTGYWILDTGYWILDTNNRVYLYRIFMSRKILGKIY